MLICALLLVSLVDSASNIMSTPMTEGVEFRKNLMQGEVVCRSVSIPAFATAVLVEASVVGLTGNPNLFGGWDEKAISDAVSGNLVPANSGGYHILTEFHMVPPSRSSFYICVTTFSTLGSDYLLTVSVSDAMNWSVPPVALLQSYPTVWRLDERDYVDFAIDVSSDISIALTPFFGEVDLKVGSDCFFTSETIILGVAENEGAEFIKIEKSEFFSNICVRVHTREIQSEFVIVASSGAPFLAQSIPFVWPGDSLRAYFDQGVDVSLTSASDFLVDTIPDGDAWKSKDGRIDISKSALTGRSGNTLFITVLPHTIANRFVLTTHSSVQELAVGYPLQVIVEGENRFRDFRVWVPAGSKFFSVAADSVEDGSGLGLFASQVRTSHDPRGYTWNSMVGGNELIWEISDDTTSERKQLKNCFNGCFLYVSVKSCIVDQGQCLPSGVSKFLLIASSDIGVTLLADKTEISVPLLKSVSKVVEVVHDATSSRLIYINPGDEPLKYWLDTRSISTAPETLESCESRCLVTIDRSNSLFESKQIFVHLISPNSRTVSITTRLENEGQFLKNHHPIFGHLDEKKFDRFMFVLPKGVDNGLLTFTSEGGLVVKMCKIGQTGCQSITGAGTIHIDATVAVAVGANESVGNYTLLGSFYSDLNSLRIGYKPIQVSMNSGAKISWQVGYYDHHEWLITKDGRGTRMCISENRCCDGDSCTLQGFGRELVEVENIGDTNALLTITTEGLSILEEGEKKDISNRKSKKFQISANTKIFSDSSVEYLTEGDKLYVQLGSEATWAKLLVRHDLYLNKWSENTEWNFLEKKSTVRVESCQDIPIVVNGQQIDTVVDLTDVEGDVYVEGKFRIALVSGNLINSIYENGIVYFQAPSGGSMYTVLCGEWKTACMAENDPHAIRTPFVACATDSVCEIPVNCSEQMVVVPDRGPEFGIFNVISALPSGSPETSSGTTWWWFMILLLAILLVGKYGLKAQHITLLRVYLWRIFNSVRFLVEGRPKSVYEELRSMETGNAYMQMDSRPTRSRNNRQEMQNI